MTIAVGGTRSKIVARMMYVVFCSCLLDVKVIYLMGRLSPYLGCGLQEPRRD